VSGNSIGGGGNGVVQTAGATFNNSTLGLVTAAGCTVVNGPDTTAGGLCASAGTIAGVSNATVTSAAPGATAYGAYARAQSADATAIGFRSLASHDGSVAIGYQAQATADPATAIGANAVASANNSVALGAGATASAVNSVALGAGSVADQANTVSFGSVGGERRLTNLAPGVNGTDAVNVNQLVGVQSFLQSNINHLQKLTYDGLAATTALAGLGQSVIPGSGFLSVGVGGYADSVALAAGLSKVFTGPYTPIIRAGFAVNANGGNVAYSASVGWHF
jgi:autotransporter adhesin